jgi:predicted amidohydrolase YtcJ
MSRALLLLLVPSILAAQQQPQQQPADLIVTNARIYTVDESHPLADAMAVRGGKVQFVGSTRAAMALRGASTRIIDLNGRTVIPGMVDAHGHVDNLGLALRTVDLTGTSSYDEVVARVAARAKTMQPGQWIIGRGWDQNDWGDTRFPTHEKLTTAVPNNPVYLTRVDGHAGLANAAALKAANITAQTRDPDGGHIERTAGGSPAGVFVDNAQGLVERVIPQPTRDEVKSEVQAAIAEAQKWGLTGVHDAGASSQVLDIYEELGKAGQLNFRLYAMISDDSTTLAKWFARGPLVGGYDNTLWIRSIKLYIDGALGSRGAALLDPYADMANTNGLLVSKPEHIGEVAARALKTGFQINTHAIGDRGNRIVLDEYEKALKATPVAGSPVPHRACADPEPRRHPALRGAWRHSIDAGEPSDERHVLGGHAARLHAPVGRVRVALAAQQRLHHPERQRFPRRAGESAHLVSRRVLPAGCPRLAA